MRLAINKKIKIGVLCASGILIVLMGILLFKGILYPGVKNEKISLYSYTNSADIDYEAVLKPNAFFENGAVLRDGDVILSEFLDNIKANFKYEFEGEREADIKGDYEITAVLEGIAGSGEEQKILWKKTFPVLQKQSFQSRDKSIKIEKEISIKPEEYKGFADNLASISRVDAQTRLSVVMNVNLNAATDKGVVEKKLSPSMVMPLNSSYFEITKNLGESKPEAIEETVRTQVPISKANIIVYSAIILILLFILFYTIFFVQCIDDISPKEKEVKKIFKNYGDRMIALSDSISFSCDYYYKVKSMEDLVRVSDELIRPIMYKYNPDAASINNFYVCDDKAVYVFNIDEKSEEYRIKNGKVQNPIGLESN